MNLALVTSGDPGGIGPDICLDILNYQFNHNYNIVIIGDLSMLIERAKILNREIEFEQVFIEDLRLLKPAKKLRVLNIDCYDQVIPGKLNAKNSSYVIKTLELAAKLCLDGISNIIVTAPVSKEIINQAGIKFLGHTEFFAGQFNIDKVVMMLANQVMKVALLTTHIPIKDVPNFVTKKNLNQVIQIIIDYFKINYACPNPKIAICGLNPHAGDGGYLGTEEIDIINPVIESWQEKKYSVSGSYSADSIFMDASRFDVILAMYHDQGLPVLKYSGFESGINVTLGLPIIRTSVDHGTAIDIAGMGIASSKSLIHAIEFAIDCNERKLKKK